MMYPNKSYFDRKFAELAQEVTLKSLEGKDFATETTLKGTLKTEEQYQLKERKALAVSGVESNHPIATASPKVAILTAHNCDIYVDTQSISADSPIIYQKSAKAITLKGIATTIYAKAVSGTGTLFIEVFA